jgi:hypothetical protein
MARSRREPRKTRVCAECGASLGTLSDDQFYGMLDIHRKTSGEHLKAQERAKTIKFFIPLAKDAEQAETVYAGIKKFVGGATERRIFALAYEHGGKQYYAEVGKPEPREGELVIAILEGVEQMPYLVCTPNRGVARGGPYLVGKSEVLSIVDFIS